RRGEVRPRRHPVPDLVKVTLQILLKCRQRLPIHTRCPTVRLHPLVRFPDELLRNVVRLCLRHRLLPSLVDLYPWPVRWAPSLHPHYQASSLRRAHPSLRPASVLGSSWGNHLEVSLGIEARGSHVPRKSLHWAHAAFVPVTTRAVSRHLPSSIPGQRLEPGFGDIPTLSTRYQRFTHVRLPSTHLTGLSRLFRNAHHLGHWTEAASGGLDPGPAARVRGALPHLLRSTAASGGHHGLLSAPSWRTIIGIPHHLHPCLGHLLVQRVEVDVGQKRTDYRSLGCTLLRRPTRRRFHHLLAQHCLQHFDHLAVRHFFLHQLHQPAPGYRVEVASQVRV